MSGSASGNVSWIRHWALLTRSAFANVTGGFTPLAVQFHGSATGGDPGYTFDWSLGNSVSASGPSITHDFLSPGSYRVTLEAHDSSGHEANASTLIRVSAAPAGSSGSAPLTVLASPDGVVAGLAGTLALGILIGFVVRSRGRTSTETLESDPTSPYQPYIEAIRPSTPKVSRSAPAPASREPSVDPSSGEDPLGDLM